MRLPASVGAPPAPALRAGARLQRCSTCTAAAWCARPARGRLGRPAWRLHAPARPIGALPAPALRAGARLQRGAAAPSAMHVACARHHC